MELNDELLLVVDETGLAEQITRSFEADLQRSSRLTACAAFRSDDVFRAIREEQFYIFTHPEYQPLVQVRMDAVVQGRNPLPLAELGAMLEGLG